LNAETFDAAATTMAHGVRRVLLSNHFPLLVVVSAFAWDFSAPLQLQLLRSLFFDVTLYSEA
jgi:hypothetical protein